MRLLFIFLCVIGCGLIFLWQVRVEVDLEFMIDIEGRTQEEICAHLSQPQNQLGLQPLLTSVEVLPRPPGDLPTMTRYLAVESFVFDPIPRFLPPLRYDNVIEVAMEVALTAESPTIHFAVESPGGVRVDSVMICRAIAESQKPSVVRVTTQISLEMSILLKQFVISQASRAQRELLDRLKVRMEEIHK